MYMLSFACTIFLVLLSNSTSHLVLVLSVPTKGLLADLGVGHK